MESGRKRREEGRIPVEGRKEEEKRSSLVPRLFPRPNEK